MRQTLLGLLLLPSLLSAEPLFSRPLFSEASYSLIEFPGTHPDLADTIPPTITCPPNVTLTLKPTKCDTVFSYLVTADDNEPFILFQVSGLAPGTVHKLGVVVNTWAVTDLAGNNAACSFSVTVQSGQYVLQCKNLFTASLGSNCSTTINPMDVIEGEYGCIKSYVLELDKTIPLGNGPWVAPTVSAADLGSNYQFRVTDNSSGNKCWGNVQVRDQTPPNISCPALLVPCVTDSITPSYLKNVLKLTNAAPTATDACGGNVILTYLDNVTTGNCDSAFSQKIIRRWMVRDANSNSTDCLQEIRVLHMTLNDLKIPADATVACPSTTIGPDVTGRPSFFWNGVDLKKTNSCTLNAVQGKDSTIALCGGSRRVRRSWEAVNLCGGGVTKFFQNIDIQDTKAPVLTCPEHPSVSLQVTNCLGAVNLPDVVVTDGCSRIASIKAYWMNGTQLDSLDGSLANFPGNDPLKIDTLGVLGVDSLFPAGQTELRYVATDLCGNTGSCTTVLAVWDKIPPLASCDSLVTTSLQDNGMLLLEAFHLNKQSSDLCAPIAFKARRKTAGSCGGPPPKFDDDVLLCCKDIGDTVDIILRVYDVPVPADTVSASFAAGQFADCTARVLVVDNPGAKCTAPPNVTVTCKDFDPTLKAYGTMLSASCKVDSVLLEIDSSKFNWGCAKGELVRNYRTFSKKVPGGVCSQKITAEYTQDYYVRFPDDYLVTSCTAGGNAYGEPILYGKDCENMSVLFSDDVFTVVPDACYKIERTWKIINWCTYISTLPLTTVPNPSPNSSTNHPSNRIGPIVSASSDSITTPSDWAATKVSITPGAPETDFSTYWSLNTNGYQYKQIIKVVDQQKPVISYCPGSDVTFGDQTGNDELFWNQNYFWDAAIMSHNMREAPVNLSTTASDACSGSNVTIQYQLFLDLDGNGSQETVVSSGNLPAVGTVNFNNANNPNFTGGTPFTFDSRSLPANAKYGFALQTLIQGGKKVAKVAWNTPSQPLNYVTPQLPYGQHRIKWFVTDVCGNETICDYQFRVIAGALPSMTCDTSFQLIISPKNFAALPLSTALPPVLDYVTPSPKVQFGIRKKGAGTGFPVNALSVSYGCTEIGERMVEIWARDSAGNTSNCAMTINIIDPDNNCNNVAPKQIGGIVRNEVQKGVADVIMRLQSPALASTPTIWTDTSGRYLYSSTIPAGSGYEVTPSKETSPLNGVTTYDLVLISKHILGLESLSSPYRLIAADANKSNSITTFDIVELRKLILGVYSILPDNKAWRFVPKSFVFPDQANPFKTFFPEKISVPQIFEDSLTQNFVAIKIGDVNLSAVTNALTGAEDRNGATAFFEAQNRVVREEDVFTLDIRPPEALLGYQFTLEHPGLELIDLQPGPGLNADHFGLFPGALTVSCDLPGQSGFAATFKALQSGPLSQMLHFSDRITRSEAYQPSASAVSFPLVSPLALRLGGGATAGFELYQNQPNPFSDATIIGFYLPEAVTVALSVYDQTGQLVYSKSGNYTPGFQSIRLEKSVLPPGVLYYRVETPTDSAVRKMVRVR